MLDSGETQKEVIRPDFNRAIMIDFLGATISSDTGFILFREIDERFRIIDPMKDCLEDLRSAAHTKHALVQLVRQRVYQIAAGYEDCSTRNSYGCGHIISVCMTIHRRRHGYPDQAGIEGPDYRGINTMKSAKAEGQLGEPKTNQALPIWPPCLRDRPKIIWAGFHGPVPAGKSGWPSA